jgi:hypothetical protein
VKHRLAWHPFLDPALVRHDLYGAAVRDPVGHRVHLGLALLWCLLAAFPTSAVEFAAVPLLVFSAVRLPNVWRTWGSLSVQPLFMAGAAWTAWQALSLLWSADPHQGLKELGVDRWLALMWALWPVMMHRRALIAALALGFVVGNLSQVAQWAAGHSGSALWEWVPWHRAGDRLSGWWDPVVGGSLLCGALGLHLPAALMGGGRARWFGVAGAVVTAAALVATGSRGAWLAAALLAWIAVLHGMVMARARRDPRGARNLALAALVLIGIAAPLLQKPMSQRIDRARSEIAGALERHEYRTDTGARVLMAQWALRAMREHPVIGVGAGGYKAWTLARMREEGEKDPGPIHAHAHSAPLHIGATLGLVGLALAGVMVAVALRGAAEGLSRWGTYDAGPLFALMGLFLAGLTDAVHVNSQTAALLGTLFAMSLVSRPPLAPLPLRRGWPYNGPLDTGAGRPPEQESRDGR